ncbi:DNA polymerase I [Candidatus Fermentibacteria bacterium]|nr:MAG: DNA polymerase I [Candidatus Fermentibacteria bacterium]PIE52259.1 MAG: DNA polymerase I [Candidatus Fermentibacteria bacterium]PIE52754.1 MAG: DNA polymerase I [Candidatus Fermentibacteria bacterium]
MNKLLILVDTLGILYRGHYAMMRRPLKGADGTITSGLSHLLSEISRLSAEYPKSIIAAAGDAPAKTFRSDIYSQYKANRPETPEDLRIQTNLARQIIPLMGIPYIEEPGLEADDIIAGLARKSEIPVLVVSPDKDLLQLVSDNISVLRPGRYGSDSTLVRKGDVPEVIGVDSTQVAEFLAIMGDSSDNIPGAKGIGKKGARTLLAEFGSIDSIYRNMERISSASLRKKLEESREAVMLSLELTRLDRPLPERILSMNLAGTEPDRKALKPILKRLSLAKAAEMVGVKLADDRPVAEKYSCTATVVTDPAELIPEGNGPLSVDTETTSKDPSIAELIGFSVSASPNQGRYFSCRNSLNTAEALKQLENAVRSRGFIAQNAKYDARVLERYGIDLPAPCGDPYLADYLIRPDSRSHSLKKLVPQWLGKTMDTFDEVSGGTGTLINTPTEEIARYCCTDSASTLALSFKLDRVLAEDPSLNRVYREIELPLSAVLTKMEARGIGLDGNALRAESDRLSREIFALMEQGADQAGTSVNLASPAQVSRIMFDILGLEPVRKTSGGARSTGMTVLNALKNAHPFVETLISFRELSKLQNTYVQKLPEYVNPCTGLIHTSFNQAVAATGRLSSSNPNLQNIPIRTARGREIRRSFIPPGRGEVFVTADYSQIELRILAHLAGEGALRDAYKNNEDIHSRTSEALFGDAEPDHRRKSKEVNFSIIYGISPYGLSQRLSVSRGQASGIISRYYETYPEVRDFYCRTVSEAESTGEVRTIMGRKRLFSGMAETGGTRRKQMERAAVNTVVQGSAADIIKMAMIRVSERLAGELPAAGLVLQVHDELVISCPEDEHEKAAVILREEMENAVSLKVPLTVETGKGSNWLDAGH